MQSENDVMKMKYSQFLWGILSLIILSNCCCICLAQQAEEEEAEYYDGEYDDEYEEYDYEGCSKTLFKSLETRDIPFKTCFSLHKYIS